MLEEVRYVNGKAVTKRRVAYSNEYYLQVWEPTNSYWKTHSCCRGIEGQTYGLVTRRHLPDILGDTPSFSQARIDAVHNYHAMLEKEARWHIIAAYPELVGMLRFVGGEGRVSEDPHITEAEKVKAAGVEVLT